MSSAHRRLHDPRFLVGHWPGRSHALDVSGHGNNGTWTGTAAYSDNPYGHGAFTGSGSSHIEISGNALLPTQGWSASVWFEHATGSVAGNEIALSIGDGVSLITFWVGLQNSTPDKITASMSNAATDLVLQATTDMDPHHVVVVKNASGMTGYLDGGLVGTNTSATGALDSRNVTIADFGNRAGTFEFNGSVWSVRLYACELTNDEIAALRRYDMTH